jgi:hypothetical protein
MMKKLILSTLWAALVLITAQTASAQVPTITGIKQDLYSVSDVTKIISSKTYQSSQFVCNQTPPPINTITVNPSTFVWDDPVNATKVCTVADKTLFDSLVAGDYLGKATFLYSDGTTGGTSNPSNPFTRFIALTPQNPRIVR